MGDVISVQVRFKKGLFVCSCGQEDVVEWSATGGNTYENNCSKCGKWNNAFTSYEGLLSYSPSEYEASTKTAMDEKKVDLFDKWLYDKKNPPAYVEPSKEDLEREKADYETKVAELSVKISAKAVEEAK